MTDDPHPIRADMTDGGLILDRARLERKLADLPGDAPVVAMVHGWRYAPDLPRDCPHDTILSMTPAVTDRRITSWPRHLGLDGTRGLGIALGWSAFCGPRRAFAHAAAAAPALIRIADLLAQIAPGRRLDVIGHSMGARVALAALAQAQPGRFGRLILLAGAETRAAARRALASAAGREAEVINVTTRENDLFDFLFEWGIQLGLGTSIGQGLGGGGGGDLPPNWRDLWIDDRRTRGVLAALGHPLPAPAARVCHWSPYLRAGTFPIYRAFLDRKLSLSDLPRIAPAPRWSRLLTPRLPRGGEGTAMLPG